MTDIHADIYIVIATFFIHIKWSLLSIFGILIVPIGGVLEPKTLVPSHFRKPPIGHSVNPFATLAGGENATRVSLLPVRS